MDRKSEDPREADDAVGAEMTRPAPASPPGHLVAALSALAVIAAAALYFGAIAHYGLDLPVEDDVEFLRFLLADDAPQVPRAAGDAGWWSQHNEHRPVVPRLLFQAVASALGRIDFRAVMFVGALALAGLAWLLRAPFADVSGRERLILWAPVPVLLFGLQHWQASLWATGAAQHYPMLLCAFASIALLSPATGRDPSPLAIALAALLASAAMLNLGAGIFVFGAGAALLLQRRQWRAAAALLGTATVLSAVYFTGYARPDHHPDPFAVFFSPALAFDHFCTVLGGGFSVADASVGWAARLFGLAGLIYFAHGVVRGEARSQPRLYAGMLFILLTLAAVTVTRFGFGTQQALDSRYRIYSHVYFALLYVSVLLRARPERRHKMAIAGLAIAVGVQLTSIPQALAAVKRHDAFYAENLRDWVRGTTSIPGPAFYSRVVRAAVNSDLYPLPCDLLQSLPTDPLAQCELQSPRGAGAQRRPRAAR